MMRLTSLKIQHKILVLEYNIYKARILEENYIVRKNVRKYGGLLSSENS